MIVMGLKEGKQKVRDRILEAESVAKTLLFGAASQSKSTFDIYFSNSATYLLYALRSLT